MNPGTTSPIELVKRRLLAKPEKWLVTGCAGFIGSSLVEALLKLDQQVVGLDNFSTGYQRNLDEVKAAVGPERAARFCFIRGDIRDLNACREAVAGAGVVLHQAALGAVPRSLGDPIETNSVNVAGFLNMLVAARDAKVGSFVYAASSSTYGDHPTLPKKEDRIGRPLSPYAVSKYANELYAEVFGRCYGFNATGLRYFNIFGARQHPDGAYAAVIPRWIKAMIENREVGINGDGSTSRDFCYIDNAVQANLLAAAAPSDARGTVYNVAVGEVTALNELFTFLKLILYRHGIEFHRSPVYRDFRKGDVLHSQADITKAKSALGYVPTCRVQEGLEWTILWHLRQEAMAGSIG